MIKHIGLAATVIGLSMLSGVANAGVPGWSRTWRTTRIPVVACSSRIAFSIQSITGAAATVEQVNANTYRVRSLSANAGVIAYCTTSPAATTCGGRSANLNILVFSYSGANYADSVRSQIDASFGNPSFC